MRNITLFLFLIGFQTVFSQNDGLEYFLHSEKTTLLEQFLQAYIQIPSVSGDEKNAGIFLRDLCRENGLHITSFGEENGNFNFAASVLPLESGKPNIVFLTHIDVVPEKEGGLYHPYSGVIKDGNVYGRGAVDNKGVGIMQLGAILNYFKHSDYKNSRYNVSLLAVSCEETQCKGGIRHIISKYLDLLNPVIVIGEGPTEIGTLIGEGFNNPVFAVSLAHKRPLWLKLEREIKTLGHGSVSPLHYATQEMVTALDNLLKHKPNTQFNEINTQLLKTLSNHKKGIEKLILKNPRLFKAILAPQLRKEPKLYSIFCNSITLTNIRSNTSTFNIIPNKVEAYLDCRLLPEEDEQKFIKKIRKRLKNDSIRITVVGNLPRTKPSSIDNIYYKNLEKAIRMNYPGAEVVPVMMPNLNDLGWFREKGITAFATIPVYLKISHVNSIHNHNEHIPVKALYEGAQVYYNFITLMNGK